MFFRHGYNRPKTNVKTRNNLLIFVFVAVLAFTLQDNLKRKAREQAAAQATQKADSPAVTDAQKYHEKTFKVVYIVDGDTIDIDIPDGKYEKTRIRLLGVDTPETKHPRQPAMFFGAEATQFVTKMVMGEDVKIILDLERPVRDRYGRLLGYVEMQNGEALNEAIIRTGHGYADDRFKHAHFDEYLKIQKNAIEQKAGLWQDVKFEELPYWLQKSRSDLANIN